LLWSGPMLSRAVAPFLCAVVLVSACGGGDDDDPPGGGADASPDDPDADIGDPGPAVAVPGERCELIDRVGLITISTAYAYVYLYDRIDPFIGEPALADDHCAFHEYAPAEQCPACDSDEVCSIEGTCVDAPRRDPDATMVLRAGGDEQTFEADDVTGELGGTITLAAPYTLEAEFFGQVVTLEEALEGPDLLTNFSAMLIGTYDAPEGVEADWDAAPEGTHVFTRVPINHHAAAPTFTECVVGAEAGELSIPGEMLEPLAVSTGLEFQGFDHIVFAAAETANGCVEIRFVTQQTVGIDGV